MDIFSEQTGPPVDEMGCDGDGDSGGDVDGD
jgi:hypothetical protein